MEAFLFLIVVLALLCLAIYITERLVPGQYQKWCVIAFAGVAFVAIFFHYIGH